MIQDDFILAILSVVILIISVILHEVSHGYMADWLGDPTPRLHGRLTLNPLRHIDPIGSIVAPIITSLAGFTFGWAKPVLYNPYNLKDKRRGEFLIAAAGPVSNLLIAVVFGLVIRFMTAGAFHDLSTIVIAAKIVLINILLAVFNLIPLPPLDGSKLFLAFMPNQFGQIRVALERLGPIFILILVIFVWKLVSPVVPPVFRLFTGLNI